MDQIEDAPSKGMVPQELFDSLLEIARSMDHSPKRVSRADAAPPRPEGAGERPGDRFSAATTWSEILEPHGWVFIRTVGKASYWRRPGKDHGLSASTGFCNGPTNGELLWAFSTNALPFEPDVTYSKFAAYAVLNHNGDWKKAAQDLADKGFGTPEPPNVVFGKQSASGEPATSGRAGSGSDAEYWSHDNLLDASFGAIRYIVHELIADESVTILGGVQKAGKSWLAIQIAQAVATGTPLFDRSVESGDVIYLALEDGARRLQDRLIKQGATHGMSILWYTKFPKLDTKAGWELLTELCARRPKLLVIDTLTAAKSGKTDESDSGPMGDLFNSLRELSQQYGIGILIVHHHGKHSSGDPAHDLRGSSAIGAAADVLLGLYRVSRKADGETSQGKDSYNPDDEGDPDFYLKARGRDIEDTKLAIRFGAGADWLWSLNPLGTNDRRKTKVVFGQNAVEEALRLLGEATLEELAEAVKKTVKTVRNHIVSLAQDGKVGSKQRATPGGGAPSNVYFILQKATG